MADLLLHVAFVFVVVIVKLLVALWVIYYLFPPGRACPQCDAETLPVQMGLARRVSGGIFFFGRVRCRWCPECTWQGFVRSPARSQPATRPVATADPADRTR
jgi:hypothetical protein